MYFLNRRLGRRRFLRAAGIAAAGAVGSAVAVSRGDVTEFFNDEIPESNVVFLSDYCAEDGTVDDGPNIQRAVDDLVRRGGGELRFTPGKEYYWDTDVRVTAPGVAISVAMTGARALVGPSAVNVLALEGIRTQVGGSAAYGQTDVGDRTIPTAPGVADSFSVGDWIMVWSSDVDNRERPSDYLSGEEAVVVKVSTSEITIDRPLRLVHKRRGQRRLFKLGMTIGPRIQGGAFELAPDGERQVAVTMRYAFAPIVNDVRVAGKAGRYGVLIDQSIDPRISGVSGEDIYDAANGTAPNGAAICMNGVIGGLIDKSRGTRCRHAVDINSFSSRTNPGFVSRDVEVNDVEAIETYGPGWTTHHVRDVIFRNPISLNCGGGGQLRGLGTTLIAPHIKGGNTSKPSEWDRPRYVAAGIAFGETDSLPQGRGFAAKRVVIDKPIFEDLPKGWSDMTFSDKRGDVRVIR